MKIVVLESLSVGEDISWEPLRQFGELTLCRDLTQNDIKEAIKDADIIIPNGVTTTIITYPMPKHTIPRPRRASNKNSKYPILVSSLICWRDIIKIGLFPT